MSTDDKPQPPEPEKSDVTVKKPAAGSDSASKKAVREAKLAEALRANLRRRKQP